MKKYLLYLILLSSSCMLSAQTPDWVDFGQRQQLYPDSEYFIGFGMNELKKGESENVLLEKLKMVAIEELVSTVQVTVESVTTQLQSQVNEQVSNELKSASTAFSKIDLTGLKTETYFDKRKKMGYALAWVNKQKLIDYYQAKLDNYNYTIAGHIAVAEQFVEKDDKENALKAFYSCMPLFREAESAYAIVWLLKASTAQIAQINAYEVQVKYGIEQLYRSDHVSLKELCSFLSYGLKLQTGDFSKNIRIGSFTYEDSRMSSPFSRRFISAFETELIEGGGFLVSSSAGKAGARAPEYILSGTYWKDGENLKVITTLRDVSNGKPLASAEGTMPVGWLTERDISYTPENFGQAAESMMQFKSNEITNGGMTLELWTNKGNDSPIFEENDTLKIYIRVNNVCYLRIVDYMADGSKVLLVDNEYIGSDKVNKIVEIPAVFQCAPPFGAEFLQANAQTKAFEPLYTKNEYGYDFIQEDLNVVLSKTRGFKKMSNEDLKAEKRVVVTTMKRINHKEN
ncbi:MAG: DUF4384 domain-containing protein [Bacteroidales bacterium]|nr:DUF4384 domain-containing protein [Bacteroidales bacterium]